MLGIGEGIEDLRDLIQESLLTHFQARPNVLYLTAVRTGRKLSATVSRRRDGHKIARLS